MNNVIFYIIKVLDELYNVNSLNHQNVLKKESKMLVLQISLVYF